MVKTVRAAIAAAALAFAGGLAGVLTAQALGQVELPTVSVPTLSLPLPLPTTTQAPLPPSVPPAPPPPPLPTVTAPAPPTPPPTPPLPTPPSPPAVPAPSAPGSPGSSSPSESPGSGVSGSTGSADGPRAGYFAAAPARPRRPRSRSRTARITGIRARRARTTKQGRNRAARITFTLNRPGRVVFVVRGPAPSCRVAGRFSVRGDRGVNHVRFTGRIGGRELPYGTYRITARTSGRAPSRSVLVAVGERPVTNGFACASGPSDPFEQILGTFSNGSGPTGTVQQRSAGASVAGMRRGGQERDSGVLPAVSERLRKVPEALPELAVPSAGSPNGILGLIALVVLLLSGLALVLYVIQFVRRPRVT